MSELYNCVPAGKAYRITKFDKDYNVTSSYLTTDRECECPQGYKETCRHRKVILPAFKQHKHIGDGWFFVFASRQWVKPLNPVLDEHYRYIHEGSAGPSPPPADASVGTPSPQPSPPTPKSKPANWRRF